MPTDAKPIIADRPCIDCGEPIAIPRPQHGPVACAETYWDLQTMRRKRCAACAARRAKAHMRDPARRKKLRDLRRDGNGR
jgi:hypothetical protein